MIFLNKWITLILFIVVLINNTIAQNRMTIANDNYLNSYSVYLKGNVCLDNNEYDQALYYYKKAIQLYKDYPEPYYGLIYLYLKQNDLNQINQNIMKCDSYVNKFKNKTDLFKYYNLKAKYYWQIKNYQNAINSYLSYITMNSNDDNIYYQIGYSYYKLKQADESEKYLNIYIDKVEKAKSFHKVKSDYNFKSALQILVNEYMDNNNYIKAYETLAKLYAYYRESGVLQRMTILSNNIKRSEGK